MDETTAHRLIAVMLKLTREVEKLAGQVHRLERGPLGMVAWSKTCPTAAKTVASERTGSLMPKKYLYIGPGCVREPPPPQPLLVFLDFSLKLTL